MLIEGIDEQPEKAWLSIDETELPMDNDAMPLQPKKAFCFIECTEFGMETALI